MGWPTRLGLGLGLGLGSLTLTLTLALALALTLTLPLPALMGRELPFGVTKLLVYASTQDALLSVAPAARERPLFALLVSLVSGLVAGSMAGLTSHPADTVVTRLTTGGFGRDWRAALTDVLSGAESDKPADQAKVLHPLPPEP